MYILNIQLKFLLGRIHYQHDYNFHKYKGVYGYKSYLLIFDSKSIFYNNINENTS